MFQRSVVSTSHITLINLRDLLKLCNFVLTSLAVTLVSTFFSLNESHLDYITDCPTLIIKPQEPTNQPTEKAPTVNLTKSSDIL